MTSREQRSTASVAQSTLETLPLHSTDLLTLLDERGVIHYESPAIERLYGYDQDELIGEQVAEYFHPEDRERVMAAFQAVIEGEAHHTENIEYRHLMADGSYRWIESVASSNPTPEGHYVVNSRDISERKERERELRQTRKQVRAERDGKEAVRELLVASSPVNSAARLQCQTQRSPMLGAKLMRNHGQKHRGPEGRDTSEEPCDYHQLAAPDGRMATLG